MLDNPQLLFVAGPNGAGKSTFSKVLSQPGAIIFDVDKIIPQIEGQWPKMPKKQVYLAATQEFFKQANITIQKRQHFTLETSFRDEELVAIAAEFKRYGYTTSMVYLTLGNLGNSISRVNKRVLNGGHFVDAKNIKLNYENGLQCLERFADQFDNLDIVDASKDKYTLESLLKVEHRHLVYFNNELPLNLKETITNIADRYRGNPKGYFPDR
jgi:predicted ABC-type ATPase